VALGMEVSLGPGHIVLDGGMTQLPLPERGAQFPIFGPILFAAKLLDASRCRFA